MDTNTSYQEVIKDVIRQYARLKPSHGSIRLDTVFDEEQGHYALMQSGWDRGVRVRGNLIYIIYRDGKIHVEYDGIEQGIVNSLMRRGVPEDAIELTYLLPMNGSQTYA